MKLIQVRRFTVGVFAILFYFSAFALPAQAMVKEAAASLILPTTGQAMNGELGTTKTKWMGGMEFGLVTGTALIGGMVGGPAVWITAGPLIANHVWSSADAFVSSRRNRQDQSFTNMQDAQRGLDLSREQRYSREQQYRSDVYDRVRMAGEVPSK